MKKISIKMFGKYSVSTILYWLFRALLFLLVTVLLFFVLSIVFGNYEEILSQDYRSLKIKMPLGTYDFILIRMDAKGIISWLSPFIEKGLFLYLLILIFKNFKKEDLIFARSSIKALQLFAILNIAMPIVYALFDILMFHQLVYLNVLPSLPNVIIGLFTLFILAVFKKGFKIQQENELTI
jgi:hypothetical protein